MERKILYPVDTASFRNIRENGFVYVDKTAYIHAMLESKGKYYFLARPRRFGKSLYLDTLAEYFSGSRELVMALSAGCLTVWAEEISSVETSGSWVYTWSKEGKKISTRSAD